MSSALIFNTSSGQNLAQSDALPTPITIEEKVVELLHSIPSALVLAQLASIDPNKLPMASRIDYLSAIERQESWIQALMQRAIIAVAGRDSSENQDPIFGVDDAEREDISTALRLSPNSCLLYTSDAADD